MAKRSRVPAYRLHKPSGQAVVTLDGKDVYLGRHGSQISRAEYDRLVAEWLVNGRRLPSGQSEEVEALTVEDPIVQYWEFALTYYPKGQGRSSELENIRYALRPLRRLYGHTQASAFGPMALKTVRQALIEEGLCRTSVNSRIGRIKRAFRWAVENELVLRAPTTPSRQYVDWRWDASACCGDGRQC